MEFKIEAERIYAENDSGRLVAEINFPETETGVYCITHTFVDDSLRGQGIAGELVERAVDEIRSKGGKITATCTYAKGKLEKMGLL